MMGDDDQGDQSEETQDTMNNQSRVKSRDIYAQKMNILGKLEQIFEQSLQADTYDTVDNLYKIQFSNLQKAHQSLTDQKIQGDQQIHQVESMN